MYKQRFKYNKMVKNFYERKKQLDCLEQIWRKAQMKRYFYDLEQFLLSCLVVYYCLMLDVDRLMLIKIHQQFNNAFKENIEKISYTINKLEVYELFIVDEITKHIIVSKSSTMLQLFKKIEKNVNY